MDFQQAYRQHWIATFSLYDRIQHSIPLPSIPTPEGTGGVFEPDFVIRLVYRFRAQSFLKATKRKR